ncbi:hypothetical protein [Streptomyces sp. NPDC053079]
MEIIDYYTHRFEEADRFPANSASAANMLEFVHGEELLRPCLPQPLPQPS